MIHEIGKKMTLEFRSVKTFGSSEVVGTIELTSSGQIVTKVAGGKYKDDNQKAMRSVLSHQVMTPSGPVDCKQNPRLWFKGLLEDFSGSRFWARKI